MKRQQSVEDFFSKKPKTDCVIITNTVHSTAVTTESERQTQAQPSTSTEERKMPIDEGENDIYSIENSLPECWTMQQYDTFKEKYDGLGISNKKLGCEYCAKYDFVKEKSGHVSKEWKRFQVEPSGKDKLIQQASLRKKMKEHFSSKAHNICKDFKICEQDSVKKSVDAMNTKYLSTTCRVFNVVYSLAKRGKPFSDIEDEIELQIKNGVEMGIGLRSRKTAVKIVDFIALEIKKNIFGKITENNQKICLIVDEASTISCKPVVVLFIKVEDSIASPTIFVELVELEKQDAESILSSVLERLNNVGLTKNYLQKNLIGFCSDGASVMLGRKSGVSTRVAKEFPNIIIWHCLSHRLQLVLDDSIREIEQVNHFKIFIDKIYTIFHQSSKSQIELSKITKQLGIEVAKIGRVLGPQWAACSLRSTLAVWHAYPALHQYFSSNPKYLGLATRLENIYFLTDLALMIDILNKISLLSNALQARNTDIIKAEKLVIQSIKAFQILQKEKGPYEKKVKELITSETYKNIVFVENHQFVGLPRERLLENIVTNLKKRLPDCGHLKATFSQLEDGNKFQFLTYLEPDYWNIEDVEVPWKAAEEELLAFNDIFHYQIDINDYRDFLENVLKNSRTYLVPESVQKAKNIARTIAVSSAEAEAVFSKMNIICSQKRSRLTVSHISNLMTISLIGLPLKEWDPAPTVQRWLREHHSADDGWIRTKTTASEDANQTAIWKYLQ